MKISFIKFLIFFCLLTLIYSCKRDTKENRVVFRYNESAGITSLDPAFARNQANIWAVNQLFNGLTQLDDELNIQPCIAKRWVISEDGLTYTFTLRDDVYFHEHEIFKQEKRKVKAQDFVYSFNRIVDPKVSSPGSWIFNCVLQINDTYAFNALNDSTLVIQLKYSFPPFLGMLSMQYCSVVPQEVVEFYGKDFRKNPVGTGPFFFKFWKEGIKLVFLKNEHYFETDGEGAPLPYLDAIAITFIIDKQTAFLEFVKGNLDFVSGIDASYKDELINRGGKLNKKYVEKFNMSKCPYLNTEYLGFLIDETKLLPDNPLKDKRIRQAINYGFDRRKMMLYLRNNIGVPATSGFIPSGMPSFSDKEISGYDYNPDKARRLLADAGYPNGKGLPPITLSTNASYLDLCQYIQSELGNIGIKIKIDVSPPGTLREFIAKSSVDFFRGSWIADYPDAENFLSLFYSKNFAPAGPNYTHFKSDIFDKKYQKSLSVMNDTVRHTLYKEMDSIVMSESPVVVLYYDEVLRFTPKYVEGLGNNPLNLLTLKRVKINHHSYQ